MGRGALTASFVAALWVLPAEARPTDAEVSVIVRFAGAPLARAPASRAELIRSLQARLAQGSGPVREWAARRGGSRVTPLWIANAVEVTAPAALVDELEALPGVVAVTANRLHRRERAAAGVSVSGPWNLEMVRAPALWVRGVSGQGAVIAVLDTGVDALHPDLASRWRAGPGGWFDPYGERASPHDSDGHGTQVASLAVGGSASGQPIGVAPGARWIAAKIYADSGWASTAALHLALQWALDPDGDPSTDDAPDVVNASWGDRSNPGGCATEFEEDVRALRAAGIVPVFAAGNDGPFVGSGVSPANYPEALAVGALDDAMAVASFSSRGPSSCGGGLFPDVAAPGANVRAADLTYGGVFVDSYANVSGTSFAAAHVAGAIALLRSAFPQRSAPELEAALGRSARDVGPLGPDDSSGLGLIDAAAAYERLATLRVPQPVWRVPRVLPLSTRIDPRQ